MRSEERIQELNLFQKKHDVPSVFGGVTDRNGALELDVVGVRRRGHQEKVTSSDSIHIGSCCKMITAALFGTFVTEHRADWEMSIVDLFPDLSDSIAEGWQQRTVAELFYCLSGMVANPSRKILTSGHSDKRTLSLQRTELTRMAFSQSPRRPGRFLYSNMSYIVMGAAIDRLCGTSYESALESRVFAPLGITSAGYGPPPIVWGHSAKVFVGGMALLKGEPVDPKENKSDNPPVLSSAGTLHLNCEDWAKLLRLFQARSNLGVIEDNIIERILHFPQVPGARMSMGWAPVELDGLSHAAQGSNLFWSATVLMDNDRQRISLVVCNDGRSSVLRNSVFLAQRLLR
ncbi:MAG: beta-lactamase family protein [Gammaproteobacteria bacterium]|nr:beta-lactamase family protein [Gammaproteobacteria bacterium]